METEVIRVSATAPEPESIARAAAILRAGGLVAFPTETVYGLGTNALDAEAVARIFAAKGRPPHNPLIVHVAAAEHVPQIAAAWPDSAERLARKFWPGPLTLVLPKQPHVPHVVTGGGPTVAVRVPAHPVALALLRAAAVPIAAPSANRSERLSPTEAKHVLGDLYGRFDLLLDGGPTPGGLESTVVDVTSSPPRLLRPGLITPTELEAVLGRVELASRTGGGSAAVLRSPGMLSRHYAPRAPLECYLDSGRLRVAACCAQGLSVGWVTFEPEPRAPIGAQVVVMPADPATYSARLYAVLHALDDAGVAKIIVDLPPETPEWLAVRDRLLRASGGQ